MPERGALVAVLIIERPLCMECIEDKSGISPPTSSRCSRESARASRFTAPSTVVVPVAGSSKCIQRRTQSNSFQPLRRRACCSMPTYYVALTIRRPAGLSDEDLIRLLHAATQRAACVLIEVGAGGLVIEAEAESLQALEEAVREELRGRGATLDRFTANRI